MMRDKVHAIVVKWMRRVMLEHQWSANEWAARAGLHASSITRILHPADVHDPMIPSLITVSALARIAGSQPDLIRGSRAMVSYVPEPKRDGSTKPSSTRAQGSKRGAG